VNLVYICQKVPFPPTKGEKIRAYHHVTELARRHHVHLVCLSDDRGDEANLEALRARCASAVAAHHSAATARWLALAALPTGRPLSVAAFDSPPFRRLVEERVRAVRPDLIVVYSAAVAPYAGVAAAAGIPRVIDFVDADSEKWRDYGRSQPFPRSMIYRLEADRLARYEGELAASFGASVFVSEAEATIVRPRAAGRPIHVVPNGVDLDAFRPPADSEPSRRPVLVFTGAMGYYPNADAVEHFARAIFPAVRAQVPEARFQIVGRDPSATVRRLARLPGVEVTGTVPDVRPYLAGAAVVVAPFRISRGVPNKILEAMASAIPVVGTRTAFQALGATEADGIRIAESPPAFAAATVALLRDEEARREAGKRARAYVERHHRWERLAADLEAILVEAARSGAASPARGRA
jgi:sugar transferase (PEP-CTERM/EpsH1 system associated)